MASPENKIPFNQKSGVPVLFYATARAKNNQADVDGLDVAHLFGHEPDALVWDCIVSSLGGGFSTVFGLRQQIRYFRSTLLASDDVSQ